MALKLSFRSFTQILKEQFKAFEAETGVNDDSVSSVVRSLFEASAMSDFRNQGDIIAALNSTDVDRAEGADLDNIGLGRGVPRPQARATTGFVSFYSTDIIKISTRIYAGIIAPPSGSSSVFVADASEFPASGQIYIGRGSNNVEGPLAYTAINPVGNYYELVLSSPTTKNHNVNESVVLAQGGNRIIPAGTVVQTAANITAQSISFRTMVSATIQDGEREVTDVPVVCSEVGIRGNVASKSIVVISGTPFAGAAVTNELPFVTGKDKMSDPDYRMLIKDFEQTKTKGTDLANRMAAIGTTSLDDNKTVSSAQIINPTNRNEPGVMYIDDSSAYQPIFKGQGFEQVIDNALGGEKYLQLRNEDITKAMVQTTFTGPFALTDGMVLAVRVAGNLYEHTFDAADFSVQNAADVFEIVNSINANNNLPFSARASDNNKRFVLFAKDYQNEDIQVVAPSIPNSVNANDYLGFSTNLTYTLRLYKNDVLLIKDGQIPSIYSLFQTDWSILQPTAYLIMAVDKGLPIVYTFDANDFLPYNYFAMASTNPISIWAEVFNSKINGITATVDGAKLKFTSNKGASNDAKVTIYAYTPSNVIGTVPGASSNLATAFFGLSALDSVQQVGVTSDYTFNRSTGQVQLNQQLVKGDVITAGSRNTRGFIDSVSIDSGSVNILPNPNAAALWLIPDAAAKRIATPTDAGVQLTFSVVGDEVTITSSVANAFTDVQPNDLLFLTDDAIYALDPDLIGAWRIDSLPSSNQVTFRMNNIMPTAGMVTLTGAEKVQFVRSEEGIPQKVTLLSGFQTVTDLVNNLNTQLIGVTAKSIGGKVIRLTSNTFDLSGSIYMAASTAAADNLGFTIGAFDAAAVSHTAFVESSNTDSQFPSFMHGSFTADEAQVAPTNLATSFDLLLNNLTPNQLISFLNPFNAISSNKKKVVQIEDYSGLNVTVRADNRVNDVIAADRFHVMEGFNFDALDNLVVILDNDSVNKALNIRMSRKATVKSTPTPTQDTFRAYDSDGGPTANFADFFGNNFNFEDFKIYLRARAILDPLNANTNMLVRAVKFGPDGERIRFGIAYPTAPNTAMNHTVSVKDTTRIKVFLASGAERLGGGWDITTQFDVTNPAAGIYRYTWNGIGTAPQFVTLANVTAGDIVNISNNSGFSDDNKDVFKVLSVTDTYFEIESASGVLETNKTLSNSTDLRFYVLNSSANKASDIEAYVDENLTDYVTIDQLESGAGVVDTSTYDDLVYTSEYVSLVDGENWILSSNVGTTILPVNEFQLKKQLILPEVFANYTLVGEEFYIIPTNADQLERFLNVFAVTGLSNIGNLTVSSKAGKIQIYSNNFGSIGSVQVSGGTANNVESATSINGSQLAYIDVSSISRNGSTVTLATFDRHGLSVGQVIEVSDANNSTFSGTFTITAVTPKTLQYTQVPAAITITPTGLSRSANLVTTTTAADHKLAVGDSFTIAGASDASFDGTFVVLNAPTPTTLIHAQVGVNASSGNGSIVNVKTYEGVIKLKYTTISINKNAASGFNVGQWIKTENDSVQDKNLEFSQNTQLQLVSNNRLSIAGGTGTFQTVHNHSGDNTTEFMVEKQGDFTCFVWNGNGTAPQFLDEVKEGDWVKVGSVFGLLNEGIYKVEKVLDDSFYIKSSSTVENPLVTLSAASDLSFYSYDSVMPNDVLYISSNVFGTVYKGSYKVLASPFPTSTDIYLETTSFNNVGPVVLGTEYTEISVKESNPYYSYKKITNMSADPFNSNGVVVVMNGEVLANKNTISAGNSLNTVNKLSFNTIVNAGEDSYKYFGGLISAVGKKLRGQATDPVTYPGVAATGSYLIIDAALPKAIELGIVVRNQTGINFSTIQSRVKTAVAAYVNSLGVGEPVVFSAIISEIQKLTGVQAIAISSPTYNASNDLIAVNYNQKAQIIDLNSDIVVTQAT